MRTCRSILALLFAAGCGGEAADPPDASVDAGLGDPYDDPGSGSATLTVRVHTGQSGLTCQYHEVFVEDAATHTGIDDAIVTIGPEGAPVTIPLAAGGAYPSECVTPSTHLQLDVTRGTDTLLAVRARAPAYHSMSFNPTSPPSGGVTTITWSPSGEPVSVRIDHYSNANMDSYPLELAGADDGSAEYVLDAGSVDLIRSREIQLASPESSWTIEAYSSAEY